MKREDVIKSDEWITVTVEVIIRSKKPVTAMRKEFTEWLFAYRDELLSLPKEANHVQLAANHAAVPEQPK